MNDARNSADNFYAGPFNSTTVEVITALQTHCLIVNDLIIAVGSPVLVQAGSPVGVINASG